MNTLIQHNLIDEYWLMVFSIVLGSGKRLFRDGSEATLKLAETRQLDSGIILLNFQTVK